MSKFPGQAEAEKDVKEALDKLPDGFWNVPESFIEDPELREMYHVIYSNLLKENEDLDTIEALLIERAAALYVYIRNNERSNGYSNSTDYRQLSQLWNNMATDLRKTRTSNVDVAQIRSEIMDEFTEIIIDAMKGFEPNIQATIKRRLLTALEKA